jgi:putative ABC transport system permease protein
MRIYRWLYIMPLRLRSLFRRDHVEDELQEELQFHIDRLTDEHIARGLPPEAARVTARRAMHGIEQRKEECRDARRVGVVEDFVMDVRYAGRTLLRSRGFAFVAIATIALGIGATVAVFTVVNGVLLRPLPFSEPDRLFMISHVPGGIVVNGPSMSDRDYPGFAERTRVFAHLAAFSTNRSKLTGSGDPALVNAGSVTVDFFSVLRAGPAAGRAFVRGDDEPGRDRVVVIGERLWRNLLGSDPAIVGKTITLDGTRRTVIGIMGPGFAFPRDTDVWIPRRITITPGQIRLMPVIGRLKPGVAPAQARAEVDAIAPQLSEQPSSDQETFVSGLVPLKEFVVGDVRRPLEIFAVAIALVLLIACANVANLLLARAAVRRQEISLRLALGARRGRIMRQLLTESLLLSIVGGACGLLFAHWLVPALAPAGRIPRLEMIRLDFTVLLFTAGVSLVTGILFGLAPAIRMTGARIREPLLPTARTFAHGRDRTRAALVVGEIALALVLLTGAGLLLRSFLRLTAVDPGFRADHVLTMSLDLDDVSYGTAATLRAFHTRVLEQLSSIPGVISVAAINWRPLGDALINGDFRIEGHPDSRDDRVVDKPAVSPRYFATMGLPLVRGRDFTDADDESAAGVAIVSRSVARLFPSEDALGKRITLQTTPKPEDWLTIVGIVDDVKQVGLAQPAHAAIYRPYRQVTFPFFLAHMTYAVRAVSDAVPVAPAMRDALRRVDRNQPTGTIVSMSEVLHQSTADPRFQTRLLGTFAGLALLLAALGTYGVLAYSVVQRTSEIGIRLALGARRMSVVSMVLGQTLRLSAAGIVIGTAGALATTRVLQTALFEIEPSDPGTFATVAGLIMAAALAAGAVPALRATRIDPLAAIRHE